MKRWICFALSVLLILLCGCVDRKSGQNRETAAKPGVDLTQLQADMLAADATMPEMRTVSNSDENADALFSKLSDVDYEKVDSYFLSFAADGMAYEIAVVVLKDSGDASLMANSLKKHVADRVLLYKSYAPDQVDQASAASILTSGKYVALVMCKERNAVKKAFEAGIKN